MQKARARSKQDIALTALDEGLELLRLILGLSIPWRIRRAVTHALQKGLAIAGQQSLQEDGTRKRI